MWKVDNYSSQPSAHWAFVGSMCKLVQWDYHLFFFFQLGDPQVNCTLLWQQQVIQKSSPKQDKGQNLSNKTAPFLHSTLSPHKQLNRGQLGFPDSETQRMAFFLSLTQPLCSTLSWAAPFWKHIYPWFYDTRLSWFHCYFFRLSSYCPLFPDLSIGQVCWTWS